MHLFHSIIIAIPITYYSVNNGVPLEIALIANGIGAWLTPDVDHSKITTTELIPAVIIKFICNFSHVPNFISRLLQTLVTWLMLLLTSPFNYFLSHRSVFSHSPLGTIIKVFWIYGLYNVYLWTQGTPFLSINEVLNNDTIVYCVLIMGTHDLFHVLIGDGGYILIFGKKFYVLGYPWYYLMKKMWGAK